MVTIKDIAKQAGVNVSTVSRALNDSDEVGEKTKQLVKKIARELNYTPNFSARALVGKATKSIGLILPEIKSNYYAKITNYLETELKEFGYTPIIGITKFNYQNEIHYLHLLSSRNVDGILFVGTRYRETEETIQTIQDTYGIPIVLLDGFFPFPQCDHIRIDSMQGLSDAVQYLKKVSVNTVGFVSDSIACINRLDNLKAALEECGITIHEHFIRVGKERFERGGYERMKELLHERTIPDAVFGAYDNMAIGALKAIYEAGLRIPEDICVVGYDNIRQSEYLYRPLTTIYTPLARLVEKGNKLLMERMKKGNTTPLVHENLATELILRETTR